MNLQPVDLSTRWWKWPTSSPEGFASSYVISDSFREEVDKVLEKIRSLYVEHCPKENFLLKGESFKDSDKKILNLCFITDSSSVIGVRKLNIFIGVPCTFYVGLDSKKKSAVCFVSPKYRLAHSTRSKIGLLIDLVQGDYAIKKRIDSEREFIFLESLVKYSNPTLSIFSIHPVFLLRQSARFEDPFRKERLEKEFDMKMQIFQSYVPQDLSYLLSKKKLHDIELRVRCCADAVFAVSFYHRLPDWEFKDESNQLVSVSLTSHLDIKSENYLAKFVEEDARIKLFLIDHEMAGDLDAIGTYRYLDPQKAQLADLLDQKKEKRISLFFHDRVWDQSFKDLNDRSKIFKTIRKFNSDYGQCHDTWALGLVLLEIICNQALLFCDKTGLSSFLLPSFVKAYNYSVIKCRENGLVMTRRRRELVQVYLTQEAIDQDLVAIEEKVSRGCFATIAGSIFQSHFVTKHLQKTSRIEQAIERVFILIRAALQIDYEKRISTIRLYREMKSILNLLNTFVMKDDVLEDIGNLFSSESL